MSLEKQVKAVLEAEQDELKATVEGIQDAAEKAVDLYSAIDVARTEMKGAVAALKTLIMDDQTYDTEARLAVLKDIKAEMGKLETACTKYAGYLEKQREQRMQREAKVTV